MSQITQSSLSCLKKNFSFTFLSVEFQKNMREEQEKVGAYFNREFMGSVAGTKRAGDDRYPNLVRLYLALLF